MTTRREALRRLGLAGVAAILPRQLWALPLSSPLRINGERLNATLARLSEFGKNPQGGVTRLAYSDADVHAREWAMTLMRDAGLPAQIDAAGNIVGRRMGTDASRKPIVFGSHVDSVPEGGNYDGDVGSLAAIEVARTIEEHHVERRHPLTLVVFQNEGGCVVGSRAWSGDLSDQDLANVTRSGKTIREGIAMLGGDVSRLASVRRTPGAIAAYVDLHIEQGAALQ